MKQPMRRVGEVKRQAIGEELAKLLEANFVKEVRHTDWVANPVLVPKKGTTKLRMCIDYTGLNKHCPKDPFALPRIDQVIDSTAGSELLCFLDAYSGYHQIRMRVSDQKATSFITPYGTYCYITMPFGLKNAGATYQRTMQRCLSDQIGRNVHVYVDDIAVMSRKGNDLISDLEETFKNLRRYKMMLNPGKCVFGVPAGKLLGFIISHRGIEVNPEKIKAILDISRPICLKDVQRLAGCVAAVSRFVSRLGEKAMPLYKLMKKSKEFTWTEEADSALQELKRILSTAPILAAPQPQEPMLLYMAATNRVVSIVIVVERKEEAHEYPVQRPVYYVSEVLSESKERYPHYQKLAYGVFLASRKLRHYFQEHSITVVSKAPLTAIINNADATGRVAKWGIELAAFDITYKARDAIKSQVLADFIADWTETPPNTPLPEPEAWLMHFDGSKQMHGSGAGVTLKSPTGEELNYVLQIHFDATNNMAEYEALLHGLRIAKDIGIKHIICCGDSDLVAQQVAGTWKARNATMAAYRDEVDELAKAFTGYEVKYVPREENMAADLLSRIGSGRKPIPPGVFLEHLRVPSVKGADSQNPDWVDSPVLAVFSALVIPPWTEPYLAYLRNKTLPEDEVLKRQIIRRAHSYTEIDGRLYKRSTSGVYQKCITREEGIDILREIHLGDCGHHAAPRSLVNKAFRQGFFWLTAKQDAEDIVEHCTGCQFYAKQPHVPAAELRTIPITWPFAVWGLDMVGKLKKAPGGFTHLLVAVDKFTKWIEAKPIRKCDGATALKFVKELVVRFGLPHSIITDNGTNFVKGELEEYCYEQGIRLDVASVAHPQSNGQVEKANGLILAGIKPRLEAPLHRAAGAWAEELPSVLWGLRTTPNRSTGFTPFFLVYGSEAVLPTDILHDSPRVSAYDEDEAEKSQHLSVDLLEEARDLAAQRSAIYQQKLRRYHSRRVRHRSFKEGDLVLRLKQKKTHKLSPPWEGPFVVSKALMNGSYYLVDLRKLEDRPDHRAETQTLKSLTTYMMKLTAHGTLHSYVLSTLSSTYNFVIVYYLYDQ